MRYHTRILVPAVLVLALVACEQTETTSPNATAPQFNFTNNPDAGPIIVRGQTTFAWFWVDPKREISAFVGGDVLEVCSGVFDFDLVDVQQHVPPGDATKIMELKHGDDLSASAWPFTVFDCNLFSSEEPLAVGLVDMRFVDNDALVHLDPQNKNSNAFGFNVHGVFNGHVRCVWDGNNLETGKCSESIILK